LEEKISSVKVELSKNIQRCIDMYKPEIKMKDLFEYGVSACFNDVPELWPITLRGSIEDVCQTAAEIGYKAIEPQICDPQIYDPKELLDTAEHYGLKYSAIATGRELLEHGLWMTSPDAGLRREAIEKLKLHIDLGEKIGAMVIVGSMRQHVPNIRDYQEFVEYHDALVYELSDYAKPKGVQLVIENITIHVSNWINTMQETSNYVHKINRDNVGIHLDTYSMLMEDNDILEAYRCCKDKLDYVHFTDGSRLYVGGSNVDFKAHMKAMLDVGYKGYVVVESRPFPDAYTCAKLSYEYMKSMEKIVQIERWLKNIRV